MEKKKEIRRRHAGMAERKGRVRFRNKVVEDKREKRRKSSSGSYKVRTTVAAATTTAIGLNATANDGYVSTTTTTNAASAIFSTKKGIILMYKQGDIKYTPLFWSFICKQKNYIFPLDYSVI